MRAIWASFRLGAHIAMQNRADQVGMIVMYLVLLLVFSAIFAVFPVEELGVPSLTRDHLLWYVAITEVIVVATQGAGLELSRIIADGQVTTQLQRPVNMMAMVLSRMLGRVMLNAMLLLCIGGVVLSMVADLPCPVPLSLLPLFLLSLLLGISIFLLCGYAVSTVEILGPYSRSVNWILSKLMFTFGGLFFPVIFFPDILQRIVHMTPFPSIVGTPGNFVLGLPTHDLVMGIVVQIMWLLVMVMLARLAEQRMVRHVLAQGD